MNEPTSLSVRFWRSHELQQAGEIAPSAWLVSTGSGQDSPTEEKPAALPLRRSRPHGPLVLGELVVEAELVQHHVGPQHPLVLGQLLRATVDTWTKSPVTTLTSGRLCCSSGIFGCSGRGSAGRSRGPLPAAARTGRGGGSEPEHVATDFERRAGI